MKFRSSVLLLSALVAFIGIANAKMTALEKQAAQIETLRKSSATVTVVEGTTPLAGVSIKLIQTRHHFGFGAAMPYWPFDSASIVGKYERNEVELTSTTLEIILNNFGKMRLKNTIRTAGGVMNDNTNNHDLYPIPSPRPNSSLDASRLMNHALNKAINKPPNGNIIFAVR